MRIRLNVNVPNATIGDVVDWPADRARAFVLRGDAVETADPVTNAALPNAIGYFEGAPRRVRVLADQITANPCAARQGRVLEPDPARAAAWLSCGMVEAVPDSTPLTGNPGEGREGWLREMRSDWPFGRSAEGDWS